MVCRIVQLAAALGTGVLLLVAVLMGLQGAATPVSAATCSVPSSTYATIQAAINDAACDTISVATGTYQENVVISRTLTLKGAGASSTTIDGRRLGPVIRVTNGANPVIEDLKITGGDATTTGGRGGGIFIQQASATIRNNVISDNVASQTPTQSGIGGGIFAVTGTATIQIYANTIQANTAYSVPVSAAVPEGSAYGCGGGVAIYGPATVVITGNTVKNNLGFTKGDTSTQPFFGTTCGGGGILVAGDSALVEGNVVQDNLHGLQGNYGEGGGVDVIAGSATINNNTIARNTGVITGSFGQGGGINGTGPFKYITVTNNTISENIGVVNGTTTATVPFISGGGGGMHVLGISSLFATGQRTTNVFVQGNTFLTNTTASAITATGPAGTVAGAGGGGLYLVQIGNQMVLSNTFRANVALGRLTLNGVLTAPGAFGGSHGGAMVLQQSNVVVVSGNTIADNVAGRETNLANLSVSSTDGGGISMWRVISSTTSNNTVISNTAILNANFGAVPPIAYRSRGGGIYVNDLPGGDVTGPENFNDYANVENNTVTNNLLVANVAATSPFTFAIQGGGIYAGNITTTKVISNLVKDNTASRVTTANFAEGGGIAVDEGDYYTLDRNLVLGNLLYPSGTAAGSAGGILVRNAIEVTSTNDIVARNFNGIGAASGSVDPTRGSRSPTFTVVNATVANNGSTGVSAEGSSRVVVNNTIVTTHTVGMQRGSSATLTENFNELANTTNVAATSGSSSPGANDITSAPQFLNAAADNFHTVCSSPGVDRGTTAGAPSLDFDRRTRTTPDIGALEALCHSIPVVINGSVGPVPFSAAFRNQVINQNPTMFAVAGHATHLSDVTGLGVGTVVGTVTCAGDTDKPSGFQALGVYTITATSADQVFMIIRENVCPTSQTNIFRGTGTYDITGGTGRFAAATGSGTEIGEANFSTGAGLLTLNGNISLPREQPFEASLAGPLTILNPAQLHLDLTGTAVNIGEVTYKGESQNVGFVNPGEIDACTNGQTGFRSRGHFTLQASNGDVITLTLKAVDCPNPADPLTGHGTGEYEMTGGTGRFAGVTGSGAWDADGNFHPEVLRVTATLKGSISPIRTSGW